MTRRKSLGTMLHRGVSYDDAPTHGSAAAKAGRWCVTEEYLTGFVVLARFASKAAAFAFLRELERIDKQ